VLAREILRNVVQSEHHRVYLYKTKWSRSSAPRGAIFLCVWYWGLNSGPSPWTTAPALFCEAFFKIESRETIFLGWLQTTILLISASWVARITGVGHQRSAVCLFWDKILLWSPGWSGLELTIFLPLLPKCWDYRPAPRQGTHLASIKAWVQSPVQREKKMVTVKCMRLLLT
jgi:hypothetical protein